jgi:transcription elongation factor GreB
VPSLCQVSKAFTREEDLPGPVFPERRTQAGPRPLTPEGHARFVAERKALQGEAGADAEARRQALDSLLERAVVAPPEAGADGRAVLGAWIEVEDGQGERRLLRLVGADEADVRGGLVRVDSPIGAALLGHQAGETVTVERPRDTLELRLVRVSARPS